MLYAPYNLSVDHLPTDLQRTEVATLRYARVHAARESRSLRRRTARPRRAARV